MNSDFFSLQKIASLGLPIRGAICVIVFVMIALASGFGISYALGIFEQLEASKIEEESQLKKLEERQLIQVQAEQYAEAIKKAEAALQQVKKQLPVDPNTFGFLAELNNTAKENGVMVQSSNPKAIEKKGFYSRSPVDISGCATFHQLGAFVASLSKLERIITLDQFGLVNSYGEKVGINVNYNVTMPPTTSLCASGSYPFVATISTYQYAE